MVATIPPLSFETTLSTLGSNVFMQLVLFYYVKKMPLSDTAKPFFLVLSLGMFIGTIASTANFIAKSTRLSEEIAHYANTVEEFGRFASLATLLFGGGFYLIAEGNTCRKDSESVSYCAWFIQLAIAILAVLATLGNFSLLADGWISYIYMILPTIGFFFIILALLIGIVHACNGTQSDDEPCTKSRRLAQLFLFFATPVAMTVATRGVDGALMFIRFIDRSAYEYRSTDASDRYGIWHMLAYTEAWIRGIDQVELFFPTVVILSALIFHPSIRGLCRKSEKSKIAPVNTSVPAHQPMMMMHPMMSTPQMMMIPQTMHPAPIAAPQPSMMTAQIHAPSPQMMMVPQTPMMTSQSVPPQNTFSSNLTNLSQPPVMYGMGGRPVYMMA